MILKDIAMLCADTARTKAYLQAMERENILPSLCIVLSDDLQKMEEEFKSYQEKKCKEPFFDEKQPILYTIRKNNIPCELINDRNINSDMVKNYIRSMKQPYLITSVYGGYILKSDLFEMGKEFIHVHAGLLPSYRGSTTAYFSILLEGELGATAIFMDKGLDTGRIITSERFKLPEIEVNMDLIYEPYIRSLVLVKALLKYIALGKFETVEQESDNAETYFIIHPVLKHLAMKKTPSWR